MLQLRWRICKFGHSIAPSISYLNFCKKYMFIRKSGMNTPITGVSGNMVYVGWAGARPFEVCLAQSSEVHMTVFFCFKVSLFV